MKHTPGPWKVEKAQDRSKGLTSALMKRNPESILIVSYSTVWALGQEIAALPEAEEAEANAALIASAPDLLAERDALREALGALAADERKFVTVFRTDADSYIAFCNFCNASHEDEYKIEHAPDCAIIQARAALGAAKETTQP